MTRSPRLQAATAAAFYLLVAIGLTWPLAANFGSQVFGAGGDTWADIAVWRELTEDGQVPFAAGQLADFGAPEGVEYGPALYIATWSSTVIRWALFSALGPVVAWNVYVLLGYLLTGTGTFLLARKLTGSARAALVAGFAYAFWPWAVENGKAHVEFAHGWVFVLLAWRMLELRDRPTLRNGLWAGLAGVVCVSYNPYYLLFGGVLFGVLALAGLIASRDRLAASLKAHAVAGGMLLGTAVAYAYVNAAAETSGTRSYGIDQLVTYGARPLNYLVPHPDNPVLGGRTEGWWAANTQGAGLNEKSLYLGITVLLLAAVAVGAAALRRSSLGHRADAWTFLAVAAVAAAFSAPPFFQPGGITIYMPSYFVYEVLPTWRVMARFGEVVMLGVALLAAIGLARLMAGRPPRQATAVFAAAAVLVPLDLWARPEVATTALPEPAVFGYLKGERPGILAEYPLAPNSLPEYSWALTQDLHDRPLLNGYVAQSREEARALWLFELSDPDTAPALRLLGVSHVVLWEGYAPPQIRAPKPPRSGFELVGRAENRSLWRVTAPPDDALAWLSQGGGETVEGEPGGHYMWLEEARGAIDVMADCDDCSGTLRFETQSKSRPRRLVVRDAAGAVVHEATVPPDRNLPVRVPLRFRRDTRLTLEVSPGPEPAGPGDDREIAISIVEPDFEEGS